MNAIRSAFYVSERNGGQLCIVDTRDYVECIVVGVYADVNSVPSFVAIPHHEYQRYVELKKIRPEQGESDDE
jgi:hypothetical protein